MTTQIAIIGSALSGNKGAAAMLEAAIEGLTQRIPDARFVLFSMYPDEDRKLNGYPNLEIVEASPIQLGVIINSLALAYKLMPPMRPFLVRHSRAIAALASSDVLLDQGGITFADGREKFLLYNVASILPALFLGVPVAKCAQAVGPFESPINRLVSRIFLPRLKLIVTRGSITHGLAEAMALPNIVDGADLAFTLPAAGGGNSSPVAADQKVRIGVSPSVVMQKKVDGAGGSYAAEMARFVEYLAERDLQPVLFPHSVRTGTDATHNNDLPLCRDIQAMLSPEAKKVTEFVTEELSSQELRTLIGTCAVLVTSRFHAMVSGLATSTPTLVMGWSHKYDEVLEMFGAEGWALPHQRFSQEALRTIFEDLFAAREEVSARIASHLPEVRERASRQLDLIAEICK